MKQLLLLIPILLILSCGTVDEKTLYTEAQSLMDQYEGHPSVLRAAYRKIKRLQRINPNSRYSLVSMGRLTYKSNYIKNDEYRPEALAKANEYLTQAIEENPDFFDALFYGGYTALYMKDSVRADELGSKMKALNPTSPKTFLYFAELTQSKKEFALCEEYCRKAVAADSTGDMLRKTIYILTDALVEQDKIYDADFAYRDYLLEDPNSAWTRGNYSQFLRIYKKDYDEAIYQAEEALKLMNYGVGHYQLGQANYCKGYQIQWEQKNHKEAIPYYEQALKHLYEPSAGLHYSLGIAYYKIGHESKNREMILKAEKQLARSVELDPNDSQALKYLDQVRKLVQWLNER